LNWKSENSESCLNLPGSKQLLDMIEAEFEAVPEIKSVFQLLQGNFGVFKLAGLRQLD